MKRVLSFICALSFTLTSSALWAKASQSESPSFQPFTGKVIGNKVRLRLLPNLEGQIVRELHKGEIYAIVAEDQDYYGVVPKNDLKAYIFRTHVLDNRIEGQHVNVRSAPNLEAPVIAQLNEGDSVHIYQEESKGKWYMIDVPSHVHLWVAKDYVEKVGPVEYAEKYSARVAEATQLLATANLISQAEFRKPFKELDLDRITKNYERVLKDYKDLDEVHGKAKLAIQTIQKEYCDRKIEFLENKAGKAALEVKSLNAKLTHLNTSETTSDIQNLQDSPFSAMLQATKPTDKMLVWQPIEYAQFQSWAFENNKEEATLQDFYQDEFLSSKTVSGIIESFAKVVKSKPGDYVITKDGQTLAYLYSTHVNLNSFVGKFVTLKVAERDNHHFAFPAYYVLDVQQD